MVDWLAVDNSIAILGFYLTTTSQFTLIFLTLFFVQRDFGHYRYLIILFSILGIAFASLEFVLYPVGPLCLETNDQTLQILHNYNGGYMFFTVTKPLNASNEVLKVMLVGYTGLYASTISLLAVQFIYRYVAVFDSEGLKYFKGIYFFLWILYVTWFGIEWALGLYIFAPVDDYTREYMRPEMSSFYEQDISVLPCYSVVPYQHIPNSTDSFVRWWNLCCTFNMTFIMSSQYGIMIYCGHQLYYNMNEKISLLSKQMRKLHKQIFKTLMLQITTPTIVLFSPIIFTIYSPLFDLKMSVPTGIFLSGFTLYPGLDAFILMYVITDYRRAFQNLAHGGTRKSRSSG